MVCKGENFLIKEENTGNFVFTINQDTEIYMSSYEMAKFMYLLRTYLQNQEISKRVPEYLALQTTYECDDLLYNANVWLVRDYDEITINVHYTRKDSEYRSARPQFEYATPEVTTTISFETAQGIISDYIELEYDKLLEEDN